MRTKKDMYKTAIWTKTGHYVGLVKYHSCGDFYDIQTIEKENFSVQCCELENFCL